MKIALVFLFVFFSSQAFSVAEYKADVDYIFTLTKIEGHLTNDKSYPIVCNGPFGGQTLYGHSITQELEEKFLAPGQTAIMVVETTFAFHFIRAWDDIWCYKLQ